MSSTALYVKNVPPLERAVRILVALAVVALALLRLPAPWSYVAAAGAVGFALTGLFGYCPACAMIGRRL
jgi:DUF2892 family protein